jgi:hypothetical protein
MVFIIVFSSSDGTHPLVTYLTRNRITRISDVVSQKRQQDLTKPALRAKETAESNA